jgi:hypothetical protein
MMTVETYIEFLKKLDGIGELWSPSGQYLGRIESNPHSFYSILNTHGFYGSSSSRTSIRNMSSEYGGFKGKYSPFNPHCSNPPFISCSGQPLMLVTRNPKILTFGLNSITPDFLFAVYEILGRAKPQDGSTKNKSHGYRCPSHCCLSSFHSREFGVEKLKATHSTTSGFGN